ncbi:hypothetical protein [Caproiciproducens sp.]
MSGEAFQTQFQFLQAGKMSALNRNVSKAIGPVFDLEERIFTQKKK